MKIRIYIPDGSGWASLGAFGAFAATVFNRRIELKWHIGQY
jgi:hypothetical protein